MLIQQIFLKNERITLTVDRSCYSFNSGSKLGLPPQFYVCGCKETSFICNVATSSLTQSIQGVLFGHILGLQQESDCLGTELGHWPHCHLLLITFLGQIIPLLHFYVIPAWTLFVYPTAIKSTSSCSFPLLTPFPNPHFFILYFQQRNTGELEKKAFYHDFSY